MGQETPFMKAWREFAMADPQNCDREWAAYLALANRKQTASGSSPTISTSPPHHRAPAAAVTAPRVSSRAASAHKFSFKPYTTVDDANPEVRRPYGLLTGDSVEPSSTVSLQPSSSGKDGLTPEARRIYDYLVGGSAAPALAASTVSTMLPDPMTLNVAPITVDITATELAAMMPNSCSSECPSHDAAVPVSMLISPTAPTSSTTTGDVLSVLAAAMAGDKALAVNAMGDMPPTDAISLEGVFYHSTDGEDPMAISLISSSAATTFNAPPWGTPRPPRALLGVPELMVQVRLSPSTFPAVSVYGEALDADDTSADEVFLATEDMFPTAALSSECQGREHCLIGGILVEVIISKESRVFGFLEKFIKEKKLLNIAAPNQATSWTEGQPMSKVWTVLLSDLNGGFSLEHVWDPGIDLLLGDEFGYACASVEHSVDKLMEMFAFHTITCELHHSTFVVENILVTSYSSWCLRCVEPDIEETWECVSLLQPKPPWSHLAPTTPTSELVSNMRTAQAWDLSSSVGHIVQYGSKLNRQILEYNGLTWQSYSYKGIIFENDAHHVSASFICTIAWFLVMLPSHLFDLCPNMPTSNIVIRCHPPTLIVVEMRPASMQLDQLARGKFASMIYMFAPTATLHHHFLSGKFTTRIEGQPRASAVRFQTHKFYFTRLSSWEGAVLVGKQWILMRCNPSEWDFFVLELVLDCDDISYLSSQFIQRDYELMQWKFPWLFSCPVLGDCLSVFTAGSDVRIFMWLQFAIKCNLGSPAELPSNKSSCAQPNFGRSGIVTIRELRFCRYSMPHVILLILKVYNPLSAGNPFGVGLLNAILLEDWLLSCFQEYIVQCGFVVNQWMIAWWSDEKYSSGGNKFAQLSCANILQVSMADWTRSYLTVTDGSHYLTSSKICTTTFRLHAYVARWNFYSMKLGCGKLLCDLGIWALLCFYESFAHAADQGGIMVEALTYCYSHYTVAFLDQDLFSHDYHIHNSFCRLYDPGKIKESHVPWDPGGSTFHRLGVKPNFKERGLSATCLHGLADGLPPWAMACLGARRGGDWKLYMPTERPQQDSAWNGTDWTAASAESLAWPACWPMPLQTVHRTEEVEALYREDKSKGATDTYDPWNPPNPPPHPSIEALTNTHQFNMQYARQIADFLAEVRSTNIIIPDHTPKATLAKLLDIYGPLVTALQEDSVPCFLHLFQKYRGHMVSGSVFTPQALNLIITENALRCAELVLEGKEPKLCGLRANPNYIIYFGYFPLHQAAETLSTDMIELLLRYGALANLRTTGDRVIEGLLPLHVAIENTCQHKYLEDNLIADQNYMKGNAKYIYKLIHLLCLPEMKIFLDTTRLLATHTDKVVDELWEYIKHGKLVPAAILLLAAQRHFRDLNGFDRIKELIYSSLFALEREGCGLEIGKNTNKQKQMKEKKLRFDNALVLLKIILKAGEDLDAYIQAQSEASHQEVLGKVSAILQNYDVGPSGKGICIDDLDCRPYDYRVPDSVSHKHGDTDLSKAAVGSTTLEVEANNVNQAVIRGQNLRYARNQFLPTWRSVLRARFKTRIFPSYVPKKEIPHILPDGIHRKLNDQRASQIRVGLLGLLERSSPKLASTYRSRRLFSAASTALNMLKRA